MGVSPAVALGNLYQATAQALANAAHNATAAQQQMWITAQATTTAGVALIYSQAAGAGVHTTDILNGPVRGLGAEVAPAPPSAE